jgi:hypothetical protein
MYVFKIITISFFLLLAGSARAQEEDESEHINVQQADSARVKEEEQKQVQRFDINGTKIADSSVAFATDSVVRSDTTAVKGKKHSPLKAVWLSAVCPGLGQAYNKKYWKIPIIYAGFGGLGYALYYTSYNFNQARAAYRQVVRGQAVSYNGYTNSADIKYFRDTYRNYLNISALVTVLWYGLNLIDAAVDGHLFNYNMDDKLSFHFDPSFHIQNELGLHQASLGLTFSVIPLAGRHKPIRLSF